MCEQKQLRLRSGPINPAVKGEVRLVFKSLRRIAKDRLNGEIRDRVDSLLQNLQERPDRLIRIVELNRQLGSGKHLPFITITDVVRSLAHELEEKHRYAPATKFLHSVLSDGGELLKIENEIRAKTRSPDERHVFETKEPLIALNFKAYGESSGHSGLSMAEVAEDVALATGSKIIVAPHSGDLGMVAKRVSIGVFAQYASAVEPGASTGAFTVEDADNKGGTGVMLNHSENPLTLDAICFIIKKCEELGVEALACAAGFKRSMAVAQLLKGNEVTRYVAVEPPELIGGDIAITSVIRDTSGKIITNGPELVKNVVNGVKSIDPTLFVLCGAGVKTKEDVRKAVEMGADGVLLASGFVKPKDVPPTPDEIEAFMARYNLDRTLIGMYPTHYKVLLGMVSGLKEGMEARGSLSAQ